MAHGNKYRIEFENNLNETYYILLNKKNYEGDTTYLRGTGDALNIKSFNSDDDRFATILSKECVISMHIPESQDVSILDFIAIEDDSWKVIIYRQLDQPPIFDGYMVVEESSQPLRDRPFQLRLRASDGLPLLKNKPLAKIDGSDFEGLVFIVDYVTHILATINDSTVLFYFDIFHASMNEEVCPFEQFQLDAKTFEKNETDFEDCYTVLETIMRDTQCRLFYENGNWHVVSIWQYRRDYGFSYWEYNTEEETDNLGNNILIAKVGKTEVMRIWGGDATQYFKLSSKSVKKTFNYVIPNEIVCNQHLNRGDKVQSLSTTAYEAFDLACMDYERGNFPTAGTTPINNAYIRRELESSLKFEKDQYIIMENEPDFSLEVAVLTSSFDISIHDKVTISVETRTKSNFGLTGGSSNLNIFMAFLTGDDGTYYTLDTGGEWHLSNSSFTTDRRAVAHLYTNPDNKAEWLEIKQETEPVPVSGTIRLALFAWGNDHNFIGNETWHKNITIAYNPFIKESFRPAKGDVNIYSQTLNINRAISETVQISDSPKKLIKGSIFVLDELATPEWHRQGFNESLRFTQVMALIKYNFSYRQFQKIEGNIKGLSLFNISEENIPFGFLPQYSFTDIPNQPNTRYILTSFEANYVTGIFRGVFVEVQINNSETYNSYDFSYLFE